MEKLERMRELIAQLKLEDEAYYVEDNPRISDKQYDALFDELAGVQVLLPILRLANAKFKGVALFESHLPAKFFGEHDAAQIVHSANDSSMFQHFSSSFSWGIRFPKTNSPARMGPMNFS